MTDARLRILPRSWRPPARRQPAAPRSRAGVRARTAGRAGRQRAGRRRVPGRSGRDRKTTPEELEAQAPEVEPLAPAVAYGDVIVRIRSKLSLPQVSHPRVDREIEWLQRNPGLPGTRFRPRAALPAPHRQRGRGARPARRPRAAAGGRERLQSVRLFARPCLGTLAVHRADRRALRPAPQLLAGPAPRRARVDARRARIPHAAATSASTATGSSRSRPTTTAPGNIQRAINRNTALRRNDRFLLAVAARRDARLRAEAGRAREDGARAGALRLLPAADPGRALLPRRADRRPGGPAPDGGARGRRYRGAARA